MKQIVSFSGGKDSTAMLLAMLERGEKIDAVVFFDFGMEFSQLYEHVEKVRTFVEPKIGEWVTLSDNWEYWFCEHPLEKGKAIGEIGYSWPNMRIRWCTGQKRMTIERWRKTAGFEDATYCIGIAADERKRLVKSVVKGQRHPLAEYGMTEADALSFAMRETLTLAGYISTLTASDVTAAL